MALALKKQPIWGGRQTHKQTCSDQCSSQAAGTDRIQGIKALDHLVMWFRDCSFSLVFRLLLMPGPCSWSHCISPLMLHYPEPVPWPRPLLTPTTPASWSVASGAVLLPVYGDLLSSFLLFLQDKYSSTKIVVTTDHLMTTYYELRASITSLNPHSSFLRYNSFHRYFHFVGQKTKTQRH